MRNSVIMNTTTQNNEAATKSKNAGREKRSGAKNAGQPMAVALMAPVVGSFEMMPDLGPIVEQVTVPGFLRMIPHNWQVGDYQRIGAVLGKTADALGLQYMQTTNQWLGVIRTFPVPLVKWVYDQLRHSHAWPAYEGDTAAEEAHQQARIALRDAERTAKQLRGMIEKTEDVTQLEALKVVLARAEEEVSRQREACAATLPRQ